MGFSRFYASLFFAGCSSISYGLLSSTAEASQPALITQVAYVFNANPCNPDELEALPDDGGVQQRTISAASREILDEVSAVAAGDLEELADEADIWRRLGLVHICSDSSAAQNALALALIAAQQVEDVGIRGVRLAEVADV
ncbi:MAG: hypothetical protein AAF810_13585 [Cyanobacteria bacterium P01_D01_bin.36]